MKQKLNERKSATKRRTAALRGKPKAQSKRHNEAEVALATLLALLHADRWLFEAAELEKKGNLASETEEFNQIRLAIVASLNRIQSRAYGAMTRGGSEPEPTPAPDAQAESQALEALAESMPAVQQTGDRDADHQEGKYQPVGNATAAQIRKGSHGKYDQSWPPGERVHARAPCPWTQGLIILEQLPNQTAVDTIRLNSSI